MMSSIRNSSALTSAFLFFLNSLKYQRDFLGMAGIYSCWNSPLAWAMMILVYKKAESNCHTLGASLRQATFRTGLYMI